MFIHHWTKLIETDQKPVGRRWVIKEIHFLLICASDAEQKKVLVPTESLLYLVNATLYNFVPSGMENARND